MLGLKVCVTLPGRDILYKTSCAGPGANRGQSELGSEQAASGARASGRKGRGKKKRKEKLLNFSLVVCSCHTGLSIILLV